ncbi:MAG: MarR family transcriptional regulator [Sphingopyxis sp.]|nr:MarR family transcriptional regulator [Sphingopyxis sp.]
MPTVSDLSAHLGYLLRMTSNAVSQDFARAVADAGVTVAEWTMLRSLYGSEALAPSVLALKMALTRGAISKLADRLLEKQFIERTGNLDDKRGHSLSLTTSGEKKVPTLARIADANDAAFFSVLNDDERMTLRRILKVLIDKHQLTATPTD